MDKHCPYTIILMFVIQIYSIYELSLPTSLNLPPYHNLTMKRFSQATKEDLIKAYLTLKPLPPLPVPSTSSSTSAPPPYTPTSSTPFPSFLTPIYHTLSSSHITLTPSQQAIFTALERFELAFIDPLTATIERTVERLKLDSNDSVTEFPDERKVREMAVVDNAYVDRAVRELMAAVGEGGCGSSDGGWSFESEGFSGWQCEIA